MVNPRITKVINAEERKLVEMRNKIMATAKRIITLANSAIDQVKAIEYTV